MRFFPQLCAVSLVRSRFSIWLQIGAVCLLVCGGVLGVFWILFEQALDSQEYALSRYAAQEGDEIAELAATMQRAGQPVDELRLAAVFSPRETSDHFEFVLGHREGDNIRVFASSHHQTAVFSAARHPPTPMQLALLGQTGSGRYIDYRGREVLSAFQPVKGTNLGLAIHLPMAELRGRFLPPALYSALAAGIISILISGIVWKQARHTLHRELVEPSQARYRLLLEQAPYCIHEIDLQGNVVTINRAGLEMLEETATNVIGESYLNSVVPAERELLKNSFEEAKSGRTSTIAFQSKNGKTLESTFTPLRDSEGRFIAVIGITQDVSDRLRAEETLRESEALLAEAERITMVGSWTLDSRAGKLLWSREIYRIFEIDPDHFEPSYEAFLALVHPDDREKVDRMYRDSVLAKTPYQVRHRLLMKDGRIKYVEEKAQTHYDESGAPLRSVGTVQDITEQETARIALEESEQRFRELADNIEHVIWLADKDRVLYVNPAFENVFQRKVEDVYANRIAFAESILHEKDRAYVLESLGKVYSEGRPYEAEFQIRRPDGTLRWLNAKTFPFRGVDHSWRSVGIAQDITERREAENALRESEDMFHQLADNLEHVLWLAQADRMLYVSPSFEKVFGRSLKDIYADRTYFAKDMDPADQTRIFRAMRRVYTEGVPFSEEYRIHRPDGSVRWIFAQTFPFRAADGRWRSVGIAQDITHRKNNLEQLQRNLRHEAELNRMRSDFISMVSHQFRTPLATMHSSVQLLQMHAGNPEAAEKTAVHLERIEKEIHRLTELTEDVLTMGRYTSGTFPFAPKLRSLEMLIRSLIEQRFDLLFPGRPCKLSVSGEPRDLPFDESMMTHVFNNLISNAYRYSEGAPEISIDYGNSGVDVRIKDHGIGIPGEDQAQVFRPFFRARNAQSTIGTGLGLAIVEQFVEMHNGKVRLQSEPGTGTTFSVTLSYGERPDEA